MKMLQFSGAVGAEVRPLYFYRAFGMEVVDARILSFGGCNFHCPYCKRDGQFRAPDGSIVTAVESTVDELKKVVDDAIGKGQVVRLSGGDPCVFPADASEIAAYVRERGGRLSMAHNGSSPAFAIRMADLGLESAAIDLKAPRDLMGLRTGLSESVARSMYERSIETQDTLSSRGVLVDIRTPVFGDTTLDDLLGIAQDIVKAGDHDLEFWTLRLYKPVRGCEFPAPSQDNVLWMVKEIKKSFPSLKLGLRAKWEPSGFMIF